MYDPTLGVEAYIRPFNTTASHSDESRYTEYDVPKSSPPSKAHDRVRYIEAITNERYEMVVVLHPKFSFDRHTHVCIYYEIDGGSHSIMHYLGSSKPREPGRRQVVLDSVDAFVAETWQSVGFAFGGLFSNEHLDLSQTEEATEVEKRGKIVITVQRGKVKELTENKRDWSELAPTLLSKDTTKKVAVDHGKSHGLEHVFLGTIARPESDWDFYPARGKAGKPIEFTFYYTSRMILEMKKIITEEPALPLNVATTSDGIAHPRRSGGKNIISFDDRDDEKTLLAERIMQEPIKTEIVDDTSIARVTDESLSASSWAVQTPRIKFEPQEDPIVLSEAENEVAFARSSSRKRRRKAAPIETIDLCDDAEPATSTVIKAEPAGRKRSSIMNALSSAFSGIDDITNIKIEPQDHQAISPKFNVVSTPSVVRGTSKSASKAREKDLLNLQLEEIKIRKRLRELEGDDDE